MTEQTETPAVEAEAATPSETSVETKPEPDADLTQSVAPEPVAEAPVEQEPAPEPAAEAPEALPDEPAARSPADPVASRPTPAAPKESPRLAKLHAELADKELRA